MLLALIPFACSVAIDKSCDQSACCSCAVERRWPFAACPSAAPSLCSLSPRLASLCRRMIHPSGLRSLSPGVKKTHTAHCLPPPVFLLSWEGKRWSGFATFIALVRRHAFIMFTCCKRSDSGRAVSFYISQWKTPSHNLAIASVALWSSTYEICSSWFVHAQLIVDNRALTIFCSTLWQWQYNAVVNKSVSQV
jgi:hypothetical protein